MGLGFGLWGMGMRGGTVGVEGARCRWGYACTCFFFFGGVACEERVLVMGVCV